MHSDRKDGIFESDGPTDHSHPAELGQKI